MKSRMSVWPATILIASVLGGGVASASEPQDVPHSLSIFAAAERALAQFPSIRVSEANRQRARASLGEAVAARFPTVNINGSLFQYEEPMVVSPIHGFAPGLAPPFDETLIQGVLGIRFRVFDGGSRMGRIDQERSQLDGAEAGLHLARQAVLARAISSYLDVLSGLQILEAHHLRIRALESELERARRKYEVGRAARVELLRVEAAIASAEAERVQDAENLDRTQRDLARLIAVPADQIKRSRLEPVLLKRGLLPARDALMAQALEHSPEMEQARKKMAAARGGLKMAMSAWWPQLDLVGNYLYFGSNGEDESDEWNTGLQISYTLFGGGAQTQAVARARAGYRIAREELDLIRLEIEERVDRTLSLLAEMGARVQSLETAVARFDEVARVERLLLDAGTGTQTDYLNAEADLLAARADLVEARHGEIAALAELGRVLGQLDDQWLAQNLEPQP